MKKDKNYPSAGAWFIAMLPYEIGLFFFLFGSATLTQVLWWGFIGQLLMIFSVIAFKNPLLSIAALFFNPFSD